MNGQPQETNGNGHPAAAAGFTAPFGLAGRLSAPGTRLDVVPVLDLCVIALLFSLVFTRFVIVPGVRVDLPESGLSTQHNPIGVAVLTIQNKGMLFFDGGVYEVASIARGFRSFLERTGPEAPVLLVKPQADLSMEVFLRICELARANGFVEVQIAAERPGDGGAPAGIGAGADPDAIFRPAP